MTLGEPWNAARTLRPDLDTDLLDTYAAELERWNRGLRLVGPRDVAGIRAQILDAVIPYLRHPPEFPLIDVGSGGGLPGIPVAIAFPAGQVTCLEARVKRVSFLRHAVRVLGLGNVEVEHGRAEAGSARTQRYATVTARAVGEVGELLEMAAGMLEEGGRVYLPRGSEAALPVAGWVLVVEDRYPGLPALGERCLLVYQRT